jgi:hypothetical protein
MEAKSRKRVVIPAQYLVVHAVGTVMLVLGAGALFLNFKDALIRVMPWLGHPDVAWTLFVAGIGLLIGNQVRWAIYIMRVRQRARIATP